MRIAKRLRALPRMVQWLALLLGSMTLSLAGEALRLPASLLLGPLLAGIAFGVYRIPLKLPLPLYRAAQAIVSAIIAANIAPTILNTLRQHTLLLLVVMTATLLGTSLMGWTISRLGLIPGATAVYGTSPGAASAMVMLASATGADSGLVALMQYVRVLMVALGAALVAHFWVDHALVLAPSKAWLTPVHWGNLAEVLGLAGLAQLITLRLGWRGGVFFVPLVLLATLRLAGWLPIELPRWLLVAGYALLGWSIGLRFRGDQLERARRALPVVFGAAVCLIAFCGLLAWCLVRFAHVDALTAYLATSPGGLDSVALIAASAQRADVSFVLALQSARLLLVIALSPLITRTVIRLSPHLQSQRVVR
jgi:uncharacterized protein